MKGSGYLVRKKGKTREKKLPLLPSSLREQLVNNKYLEKKPREVLPQEGSNLGGGRKSSDRQE